MRHIVFHLAIPVMGSAFVVLPIPAAMANCPESAVKEINHMYLAYVLKPGDSTDSMPSRESFFAAASPQLAKLISRYLENPLRKCFPNWEFIVADSKWNISDFESHEVQDRTGKCEVFASFRNFGKPVSAEFEFSHWDKNWAINDANITSASGTFNLQSMLTQNVYFQPARCVRP